jgi:hypothetical protein
MTGDEVEETAKAVRATAETAGKAIDAGRDLGGFLARIFGGPLEQVSGMIEDSLRFRRLVRLERLAERYEQIRLERNIPGETNPIEMKIGIPLIAAASLEENDELQDMFARLLVNATDPNAKVKAQRAFVTILEDMGPLEAHLLERIYSAPTGAGAVPTAGLPDKYLDSSARGISPPEEISMALWNLVRLGCITPSATYGGGGSVGRVTLTELGRALIEACTVSNG